jgi:putative endonuclease
MPASSPSCPPLHRHARESGHLLKRGTWIMRKGGWVYIMTNRPDGTLYIGVTSDLMTRASQHRAGETRGFTQTYWLRQLVYYERHEEIVDAIGREKVLKKWRRAWKVDLIQTMNPEWHDLYDSIL